MSTVPVIDPNKVNTSNIVNGIPKYEDMSIYVKLSATTRDRSVLIVGDNGVNIKESLNASAKGTNLNNFIRFNSETTGDNGFKTNWIQNGVDTQDDAFGIQEIKIVTNSSYIPQVSIKFIDVRGAAFFNNANSPYRLLFDFPPPIFELTVKGYYGAGLTYKLHMVKYTTEFLADSGNYVIDAQFVAVTFAPLADIPLRYITQFAYINNGLENIVNDTDSKSAPKSTNELIIKAANAYAEINKEIGSSPDKNNFDIINAKREKLMECVDYINSLVSSDTTPLIKGGIPKFYIGDIDLINSSNSVDQNKNVSENSFFSNTNNINPNLTTVKQISEYQNLIIKDTTKKWGLFLGYEPVDYNSSDIANNTLQEKSINDFIAEFNVKIRGFGINIGSNYRKLLFGNVFSTLQNKIYYTIDISEVSKEVLKQFGDNDVNLSNIKTELNNKINQIVLEKLGMYPSIANIFSVILNDVDHFFDILRQTSKKAIEHHEKYKEDIFKDTQYVDTGNQAQNNTNKQVYAFPLVIDNFQKVSPIKLANTLSIPKFPEVDLVDKFIKSFDEFSKEQEAVNMKNEMNETGNKKWIPFTPLDSSNFGITDNPYLKVGSSSTGVITSSFQNIMNIALNRYYILKQYSYYGTFDEDAKKIKPFDELFGNAEAVNIYNTISGNSMLKNLLNVQSNKYKGNIDLLYTEVFNTQLQDFSGTTYNFPIDTVNNLPLSYDYPVFIDKTELLAKPQDIEILTTIPTPRVDSKDETDLINKFIKDAKNRFWEASLPFPSNSSFGYYKYSIDNLIYIDDNDDNDKLKTKFIFNNFPINFTKSEDVVVNKISNHNIPDLNIFNSKGTQKKLNLFGSIEDAWLFLYDDYKNNLNKNFLNEKPTPSIQNILTKTGVELTDNYILIQNLLIVSNFGRTASPFNIAPNYLNEHVFNVPVLVVTPEFLPLYLGILSKIVDEKPLYEYVVNFFQSGDGAAYYNDMLLVFADINDTRSFLSENDRDVFKEYYNKRYDSTTWFVDIMAKINNIYIYFNENYSKSIDTKELFKKLLTDSTIYDTVMTRVTLVNNTSLTFFMESLSKPPKYYTSLATENTNTTNKEINQKYFEILLTKLNELSQQSNTTTKKTDDDLLSTNDDDIINETYYSFKNINDKWLAGIKDTGGYPFMDGGSTNLFNQFAFVDRTGKDIGRETMINPETLVNIFNNDTDISIYSALSQLLSLNGFEFFPLQNFIKASETNIWSDKIFKINIDNKCIETSPTFVCMYVGGSSSYATIGKPEDQFLNDGMTTFDLDSTTDFNESSNVKAFKVKFGEQAQSHFVDIKIDSKEHPETNESIQILARLAGDEKQRSAIPKGQNLYNLYENRSYKATITGLGNVMFQPTQYFQLENVPMYNGIYIILSVEHMITPNKMVTSFSGTKIAKYPKPRVTSPSTIFNKSIGNSSTTSNNEYISPPIKLLPEKSGDSTVNATNKNDIPRKMQNNAMYTYGNGLNQLTYTPLIGTCKDYINKIFGSDSSTSMVKGHFYYKLPYSNVNSTTIDYYSNNPNLQTNGQWKKILIDSINNYAKIYDIDANIIAAQIAAEGIFSLWAYSETGSLGVSQFQPKTLHDIVINNWGDLGEIKEKFTKEEQDKIHYNISYGNTSTNDLEIFNNRENRMQVFQNLMDNPDLAIKAQCRYMKWIANHSNNLLSTTTFAYNRGIAFADKNYLIAYNEAKTGKHNVSAGWETEGVKYVYTIFNILSKFGGAYPNKLNMGGVVNSWDYDRAVADSLTISANSG